jgi:Flp pilus assembly protein TadG
MTYSRRSVPRKKLIRDQRGQSVAEFALVLPLLMLILLAILQFGVLFRDYLAVTDAVRAGARKGAVSRNSPTPQTTCEDAVRSAANDLDLAQLTVDCTSTWTPAEDVTVTATYPYEISLLGKVVKSGRFTSTTTERVE